MSVVFAEDLQSRDLVAMTVIQEASGSRARTLAEILARDRQGQKTPTAQLLRRNNGPIVPVGAEATVQIDRATWGKLRKVWPYVAVSRTKRYAVILPERPGADVAGAALTPTESREALIRRRFDFHAEPVVAEMERLGPPVEIRENLASGSGVIGSAPPPPVADRFIIAPAEALNIMFVDVPLTECQGFETAMQSTGAQFHPIQPLRMQLNKPHLPKKNRTSLPSGGGTGLSIEAATNSTATAAASSGPTRVRLGAVDTGVSLLSQEFAGRADSILFAQFSREGTHAITAPVDDHGHGTCVLTRAAGAQSGIVPNASLVVAAALPQLRGEIVQTTQAISWLIQQENVGVINLSLVSTDLFGRAIYQDIFKEALRTAEGFGVYLIAATGNDGPGRIGAPGAYKIVQGVGATDGRGEFWRHSGHGLVVEESDIYKPNWIAHGEALQPILNVPAGHTGTSYACPIVSGLVLRALVNGLDPLAELERCSDPWPIGTGRHKGNSRKIRWPVPE